MPRPLEAVLLAVLFALAHTQSPLYFSNQNQYFVHGLADAHHGHLSADWLANTRDPTAVFSALVTLGYRTLGEWSFRAAYFLLLMGYFVVARRFVAALALPDTRAARVSFAALFTAAHAGILRFASVQLTGVDYPWYLQAGVAGQYMLGSGLQPSAFGVLLFAALAAFAHDRPVPAAALAASACVFHSTYLLPAGLLVVAMMLGQRRRDALRMGGVALLIVLPVVAHTLWKFAPTDGATFAESQRILAEVRIPHHAVVGRWWDAVAAFQVCWVLLGVTLLRRTRAFPVVGVLAACGFVLTAAQWASGNPTFALLFPWRVSVLLVPVATAAVCAYIAVVALPAVFEAGTPGRRASPPLYVSVFVLIALAVGGIVVMTQRLGYHTNDAENDLYAWVRANAKPGDVFLLPVRIPAVGGGRGSVSTSFTPPPRPKPGSNLIPVDLQRFRLHAAAPIYVDFKAVPYADVEVREWLRRMKACQAWYDGGWNRDELKAEGVTHVVAARNRPAVRDFLDVIHMDDAYLVYRVK